MTEGTVIMTAIIGFASGGMAVGMWLWPAVSRIRTERDRLQSEINLLRNNAKVIIQDRDIEKSISKALTDKVATLTRDCVELQMLAHEAQAAHATTKRQLAAAKGQITKLKRRIEDGQRLNEDDVQWIVNSIAELGVLINGQAFFLYKGRSLVYETAESEDSDGGIMMYRPVFKREFGECCHPLNYSDPTKIGTVNLSDSDNWMPLPEPPQ